MFMLGLLSGLHDTHYLFSNKESGLGYADLLIIPRDKGASPGIIIEFKHLHPKENIEAILDKALEQIIN